MAENRRPVFLAIIGVLLLSIIPMPALSPIIIVLFGLILGIFMVSVFAPEDFRFLFNLYLVGFTLRIFLSFFFYILSFSFNLDSQNVHKSPGFLFQNDGWLYSIQGWEIFKFAERGIYLTMSDFLSNPDIRHMSGNITSYDYFSSYVYSVTGYSPLSLFFISSIVGSLAALFVYLIAKELFSKRVARISSLFAFFWPSFIMWSTQNLREPMIAMLGCALIWSVVYMHRHPYPIFLLVSFVSAWGLFKVSSPYAVIIVSIIFFVWAVLLSEHLFRNRFVVLIVIGLVSFLFLAFNQHNIMTFVAQNTIHSDILDHKSIFEFLDYHRMARSFGRLQFLKNTDISNFGNAFVFAPLGLLYAVFAPFPWQLGSFMQVMAVPETLVFYILFPATLRGVVFVYKKRFNQSALLLFAVAGILIFLALVEGNSGTLFRHRFIAFNLLFIFTAIGLTLKRQLKGTLQHE